jgi:hypothetical protein
MFFVKCVRARINQVFLVLDFSFVLSHSLSQNRYFWDPVCVKVLEAT